MYFELDKKHETFDLFDSKLVMDIWRKKYFNGGEQHPDEVFARVSNALYDEYPTKEQAKLSAEDGKTCAELRDATYEAMKKGLLMPAGRILSGAGSQKRVTLMNCFVGGVIEDSMEGIMDSLKESALTMQQGGGIGNDFSTIRPKGALLTKTGSQASGPIYFMDLWNAMCSTIMSAGARRGAMMGTLCDTHPDLIDFIEAKQTKGRLTNFNLSILVSQKFLDAVENDDEWLLYFHEPKAEKLDCQETFTTLDFEGNEVTQYIYSKWKARELWELITKSTYEYSEPGVIFIDRINEENNLNKVENIRCTNPCGEQPLPPYGTCNLGAVNLARMVKNPYTDIAEFDFDLFFEIVSLGVRFLDSVINIANYPLEKQRKEEMRKRRLGLGISGLADCLAQLGMPYGSEESVRFTDDLMEAMANRAYQTSSQIGKELGNFPLFTEAYEKPFIAKLDKYSQDCASKNLRNGLILTIAPTGTTSIAFGNISSGLEPVFAHSITRNVRKDGCDNLDAWDEYTEWGFGARFYSHCMGEELGSVLPDFMNTMNDLALHEHLEIQGACQNWVDASVSKTINCPPDISYEDFVAVYKSAHEFGCKGCTTYRPSETRGNILADAQKQPEAEKPSPLKKSRGDILQGVTYKIKWPSLKASMYVTVNHLDGVPYEVFFASKDSRHSEWMTALTLMISSLLRNGVDPLSVSKELLSIVSAHDSAWSGKKHYASLVAKIGDVLDNHFRNLLGNFDEEIEAEICPECNEKTLVISSGCKTCLSCGFSKCG